MSKFRIGTLKEKSLHRDLKNWYKKPGDVFEQKVNGYIIDIVRQDLLIEIQTRNVLKIKRKLFKLTKTNPVQLIIPLYKKKTIAYLEPKTEKIINERVSPRKDTIFTIFKELIYIPTLLDESNLTLTIPFLDVTEFRMKDGKGSWRRKGVSIIDKKLNSVVDQVDISNPKDFLKRLPNSLPKKFTVKEFGKHCEISRNLAYKTMYCLKNAGVCIPQGREKRAVLYKLA